MLQWRRIQEDAREGIRLLRDELQSVFARTVVRADQIKARRALSELEQALQDGYQRLGEKVYQHLLEGEKSRLNPAELERYYLEIEQLKLQQQQLSDELKAPDAQS